MKRWDLTSAVEGPTHNRYCRGFESHRSHSSTRTSVVEGLPYKRVVMGSIPIGSIRCQLGSDRFSKGSLDWPQPSPYYCSPCHATSKSESIGSTRWFGRFGPPTKSDPIKSSNSSSPKTSIRTLQVVGGKSECAIAPMAPFPTSMSSSTRSRESLSIVSVRRNNTSRLPNRLGGCGIT